MAVRSRHMAAPNTNFARPASNMSRMSIHRSAKTAMRRGAALTPRPGRQPAGASGMQSSATSSISWSGCVAEKKCPSATNERKHTQQTNSVIRGQRFSTTPTAAARPVHSSRVIMPGE